MYCFSSSILAIREKTERVKVWFSALYASSHEAKIRLVRTEQQRMTVIVIWFLRPW